jgi:outer membrane cobalamin receptor
MLILIDGHPQYMGLMGHSLADAYQSLLAEKVEVIRGPGSVLYGSNAMGGVINIITRKQWNDGLNNHLRLAAGSFGTMAGNYTGMFKTGRFSGVLAAEYNRTDGHRSNMDFNQFTGYTKLAYQLSTPWKLSADLNITRFNSSNPGTESSPLIDNDAHITRGMTSASLTNDYRGTSGALTLYYNWGNHKVDDGYSIGASPKTYLYRSDDEMWGANWYQTVCLLEGNRTTVGFDYMHTFGRAWDDNKDGTTTDIADKDADEVAGYVDFRQTLFDILTLDGGLRVDHYSHSGTEWIPQIGASVILPGHSELKAMVSKGFRNPTLKDLYMFRPKNPDLSPEKMMNYELSFHEVLLDGRLKYGVNIFYIDADNLIETTMVDGKPLNTNTGALKNWGIESEISYRLSEAFNLSANYSYLHTDKPVTAAPRHKLYMEGSYTKDRWNLTTGIQWIGHLYTAVSPETTEDFVLWNIRASYRLTNNVHLFVKGENLLAQEYEINAGFPMPRATFMGGVDINF